MTRLMVTYIDNKVITNGYPQTDRMHSFLYMGDTEHIEAFILAVDIFMHKGPPQRT